MSTYIPRPPLTPERKRLRAQIAGSSRWAMETDRAGAMQHVRDGFTKSLERKVDPDGNLSPVELAKRVESARKAHYARLRYAALKAREAKKA